MATTELPMTCLTCGHRYADNTPAGRCPREADHEPDDDYSPDADDDGVCLACYGVRIEPGTSYVEEDPALCDCSSDTRTRVFAELHNALAAYGRDDDDDAISAVIVAARAARDYLEA